MPIIIPYAFFDAPQVINPAVTPIPAASALPLQIIADSGINYGVGITFIDSTGDFIGVYTGRVGFEQLICIIGNGVSSQSWGTFPPHSRVSLRSMENQAITGGTLTGALFTA